MTTTVQPASPVLVGVDDSPASLAAIRVAADEAALRGTDVLAIHVWHYPSSWGVPLVWPEDANPGRYVLDRLTAEVEDVNVERRSAGKADVTIRIEVIEGDAVKELRSAAANASILVLGERGGFSPRQILGSVSHGCAVHPPCPVLIVPSHDHRLVAAE
jgi:nucleotide-binding universal stress UspA family protein